MSTKTTGYILTMILVPVALIVILRNDYSDLEKIVGQAAVLILVPAALAFITDPFWYVWKKFIRKKDVKSPFKDWSIDAYIESVMAWWILLVLITVVFVAYSYFNSEG